MDLCISYSFYKLLWYLNLCLIKLIPHRPLWYPWTLWHHSSKYLVHQWLCPWHPSPAPVPILHSTWSISDYVLDIRPLLLVLVPGPSVTTSLTSFPFVLVLVPGPSVTMSLTSVTCSWSYSTWSISDYVLDLLPLCTGPCTWSISDYVLDLLPLYLVLVPGPSVTTSLTSFPCSCARFPSTENTATPHTKGDGVKVFFHPNISLCKKAIH